MPLVDQDKFGALVGNCFPACVASILGIPLETIPNFCALANFESLPDSEWFEAFIWWCNTLGWSYIKLDCSYTYLAEGQVVILTGKSPRGEFNHCVVGVFDGESFVVAHDPHSSRQGLDGDPTQYGMFIPTDPLRFYF